MKRLSSLSEDPLMFYDAIAEAKYKARDVRLAALRSDVAASYDKYLQHAPEFVCWHAGNDTDFAAPARIDLLHCYTSETTPRNTLVSDILALSPDCPYCGINQTSTIDHYLPKADYEQFSVFPPNLVPSCGECNTLRKPWVRNGDRTTLHFFFDEVEEQIPILTARIVYEGGEYLAEYSLATSTPVKAPRFIALYRNQCELLDLLPSKDTPADAVTRFKRASGGKLKQALAEINDLRDDPGLFNTTFIASSYRRRARALARVRGVNNWEVALYRAISESADFIDYGIRRAIPSGITGGTQ